MAYTYAHGLKGTHDSICACHIASHEHNSPNSFENIDAADTLTKLP